MGRKNNKGRKEKRGKEGKKAPPQQREMRKALLEQRKANKERKMDRKRIMKKFLASSASGNLEGIKEYIDTYHLLPNQITKGLFKAVQAGNLKSMQLLMMYPLSRKQTWNGGYVLIRTALERCHVEIAKILLREGANVVHTNKHIDPPLYLAIATGDTELVEMLIQKDFEIVHWADAHERAPLHVAVENCDDRMVQLLLSYGAVSKKDIYMIEPLHIACFKQQPTILDILLNHRVESGSTSDPWSLNLALLIASARENEEIVLTLLKAGADPNFCLRDDVRQIRYSISIKAGSNPLLLAYQNRRRSIMDILLKHGAQDQGFTLTSEQGTSVSVKEENNVTPMSSYVDAESLYF